MLTTLALTTLIAGVPPNVPLPTDLELCIHKAEICVLELRLPKCGKFVDAQQCVSEYESCSFDFPEAHEPSCRVSYVWCKLEEVSLTQAHQQDCEAVYAVCPTL